jgi:hypothetical protein
MQTWYLLKVFDRDSGMTTTLSKQGESEEAVSAEVTKDGWEVISIRLDPDEQSA